MFRMAKFNLVQRTGQILLCTQTHTPLVGFIFPKPIIHSGRHLSRASLRRLECSNALRFHGSQTHTRVWREKNNKVVWISCDRLRLNNRTKSMGKTSVEVKWIEKSTRANFTSNFPKGLFSSLHVTTSAPFPAFFFLTSAFFHKKTHWIWAYLSCSWLWWHHTLAHCSVYTVHSGWVVVVEIELGRQTASGISFIHWWMNEWCENFKKIPFLFFNRKNNCVLCPWVLQFQPVFIPTLAVWLFQ